MKRRRRADGENQSAVHAPDDAKKEDTRQEMKGERKKGGRKGGRGQICNFLRPDLSEYICEKNY